jgi:hypothetical protein
VRWRVTSIDFSSSVSGDEFEWSERLFMPKCVKYGRKISEEKCCSTDFDNRQREFSRKNPGKKEEKKGNKKGTKKKNHVL